MEAGQPAACLPNLWTQWAAVTRRDRPMREAEHIHQASQAPPSAPKHMLSLPAARPRASYPTNRESAKVRPDVPDARPDGVTMASPRAAAAPTRGGRGEGGGKVRSNVWSAPAAPGKGAGLEGESPDAAAAAARGAAPIVVDQVTAVPTSTVGPGGGAGSGVAGAAGAGAGASSVVSAS